MNSTLEERDAGGSEQSDIGLDLEGLIAQYEVFQSSLRHAIENDNESHVSEYDKRTSKLFDRILEFPAASKQDRILLVEFLLEQLDTEPGAFSDRIKFNIVEIIRNQPE